MGVSEKAWEGAVVSIHIAPAAGEPMVSVPEAQAEPGKGLKGDRYSRQAGTYSDKPGGHREVTLIEIEALEALERDYRVKLAPGESRRNVVTRGVLLNHLVGREFWIGEVALRGLRLCEPCSHLARLSGKSVLPGLVHRGGLRAQILVGGMLRVDAVVRPESRE